MENKYNLTSIEHDYIEKNKEYDEGNLSKEEYTDLLKGLSVEEAVCTGVDQLHRKQELQKRIEQSIKVISAIL